MCWSVTAKGLQVFGPLSYPNPYCMKCGEDAYNPEQSFEEWLDEQ